jgi:hypothetical protein
MNLMYNNRYLSTLSPFVSDYNIYVDDNELQTDKHNPDYHIE